MAKKTILFNKKNRFKKSTLKEGMFFCDQHLLKNQLSFDDLEEEKSEAEETAEKLGEASQEVAKQKSKKKKITNAITFALNIVIVVTILAIQFSTTNVQPFDELVRAGHFKWQFIIVILACFAIVMFLDTFRATVLLKESSKRSRPFLCYKMNAIGKYWDCVTPMSTGGQPFQIFYLNKHGVDAATAISIPLARYVVFQIAWTLISLFVTIYYVASGQASTGLVTVASYIGFVLNILMIVGVWFLSVSKRVGRVLVAKTLKLLQKMRLLKNYEKVYDKVMDTVNGFQTTMKIYTKNIKQLLLLVLTNIIQLIVNFSMPIFIYLMLGGVPDLNAFITIFVYSILVDLASGFIPLPGGTGMSEVAFTIVMTSVFPEGTVVWGLLLWRFMNYYIYLVQGLLVTVYDYIWGQKKYLWQKRKWELEAESNKFKESQLKRYNKRTKGGKIKI